MAGQVGAERAADARLVVDQAVGRDAPLPRQLDDHRLEPVPGVVEDAVPLGREDRQDLLPVPHHDHRAIGPDTAADIHAHERASRRVIGPELIAGHALPRAGVEPGRRQEPHRLLTREDAEDVRPPPGRFLAVNLAHLVQERPRRHPDG